MNYKKERCDSTPSCSDTSSSFEDNQMSAHIHKHKQIHNNKSPPTAKNTSSPWSIDSNLSPIADEVPQFQQSDLS